MAGDMKVFALNASRAFGQKVAFSSLNGHVGALLERLGRVVLGQPEPR